MTYSMQCTCGHVLSVDAESREDAVAKMKEMMTQDALEAHLKQYHKPDEPVPTLEQSHAMIDQMVVEGQLAGPSM